MSTTNTVASVNVPAMQMQQLYDVLTTELNDNDLSVELQNKNDTDLGFMVKRNWRKTRVDLRRPSHKPLEVEVEADYAKLKQVKKDKPRPQRGKSSVGMFGGGYRWLWLFLIFGGAMIVVIQTVTDSLEDTFIGQLSQVEQLFYSLAIIVIGMIIWLVAIPSYTQKREAELKQFDEMVVDIIITRLKKLRREMSDTDTVKCWSCFGEISIDDVHCSHCGKEQT